MNPSSLFCGRKAVVGGVGCGGTIDPRCWSWPGSAELERKLRGMEQHLVRRVVHKLMFVDLGTGGITISFLSELKTNETNVNGF